MTDRQAAEAALAAATFLYRTSSNIPLPPDFWERQSRPMKEPFLTEAAGLIDYLLAHPAEAAAVAAALRPEPDLHDVAQRRGKELGEWRREPVPELRPEPASEGLRPWHAIYLAKWAAVIRARGAEAGNPDAAIGERLAEWNAKWRAER